MQGWKNLEMHSNLDTGYSILSLMSAMFIGSLVVVSENSVLAQINPDNSLGNDASTLTQGQGKTLIKGGLKREGNLFHSFREFNIGIDQRVLFDGNNVNNIFTRVTGETSSNINGILGVNGGANLFLLNPNGIIFGPNAQLELGGSFLATTADSFVFQNGFQFSAGSPKIPPVLTINIPLGLQFGEVVGSILSNAASPIPTGFLTAGSDHSLSFIGGDIELRGTVLGGPSPPGNIELGSVGKNDFVNINLMDGSNSQYTFNYENSRNFHDIRILQGAAGFPSLINPNGPVKIQGRFVNVTNGSQINSQQGSLIVNASETLTLSGSSPSTIFPAFANQASQLAGLGGVKVETKRLILEDGTTINSNSTIPGNGGDLIVKAYEFVEIQGTNENGPGGLSTSAQEAGRSGDVTIDTKKLTVKDGAIISTKGQNLADGGTITIKNADAIILDSTSPDGISRSGLLAESGTGRGGNIKLDNVNLLLLRNNGLITTDAGEFGTGGNIDIDADVVAAFPGENSDITANADQGSGGKISITTQSLLGLEVRDQLTPLSDITAFSLNDPQLNGQVTINTPETDPSEGVVELPAIAPQTPQIAQSCRPGQALGDGSLVNLGRGGLPSTPRDVLTGQAVWEDLRSPVQPTASRQDQEPAPPVATIVEAQGWQRGPDGRVTLVPPADASSPQLPTPAC
jgi:filamentous hemagglutinin family protein